MSAARREAGPYAITRLDCVVRPAIRICRTGTHAIRLYRAIRPLKSPPPPSRTRRSVAHALVEAGRLHIIAFFDVAEIAYAAVKAPCFAMAGMPIAALPMAQAARRHSRNDALRVSVNPIRRARSSVWVRRSMRAINRHPRICGSTISRLPDLVSTSSDIASLDMRVHLYPVFLPRQVLPLRCAQRRGSCESGAWCSNDDPSADGAP